MDEDTAQHPVSLQEKKLVLVVKNYIKTGTKFLVLSSFAWLLDIVLLILSAIVWKNKFSLYLAPVFCRLQDYDLF